MIHSRDWMPVPCHHRVLLFVSARSRSMESGFPDFYLLLLGGRATFEGTLKAKFANVFEDKEAAFGNVIFQSGFVTSLGFAIAANANIGCTEESNYCIKYEDGKLHNTLVLELLIAVSPILVVAGYHRAKYLYKQEQRAQHELESRLLGDDHML